MKTLTTLLVALFVAVQVSHAQETESAPDKPKTTVNLGIGAGLTYGGLGGRFVVNPSEVFSLFVGLGYNLDGLGYNVGPIVTIPSESRAKFYLAAMYGYNGVIVIEGLEERNKTYYGASAGVGIKLMSKRNPGSYWDFGLIVPFRSSEFKDDWDDIKNDPFIEVTGNPWPVNICIGYNFKL